MNLVYNWHGKLGVLDNQVLVQLSYFWKKHLKHYTGDFQNYIVTVTYWHTI